MREIVDAQAHKLKCLLCFAHRHVSELELYEVELSADEVSVLSGTFLGVSLSRIVPPKPMNDLSSSCQHSNQGCCH
jgi:hypothetical protein